MSSLYERLSDADWHYLDEMQVEAVNAGARDAFNGSGRHTVESLGDFEQDAMLYAALHRTELEKIRTFSILRKKIRDRLIRDGKEQWGKDRLLDYPFDEPGPEEEW